MSDMYIHGKSRPGQHKLCADIDLPCPFMSISMYIHEYVNKWGGLASQTSYARAPKPSQLYSTKLVECTVTPRQLPFV